MKHVAMEIEEENRQWNEKIAKEIIHPNAGKTQNQPSLYWTVKMADKTQLLWVTTYPTLQLEFKWTHTDSSPFFIQPAASNHHLEINVYRFFAFISIFSVIYANLWEPIKFENSAGPHLPLSIHPVFSALSNVITSSVNPSQQDAHKILQVVLEELKGSSLIAQDILSTTVKTTITCNTYFSSSVQEQNYDKDKCPNHSHPGFYNKGQTCFVLTLSYKHWVLCHLKHHLFPLW